MGKKDTKTKMKKNPMKASLEFKFNTRKVILSYHGPQNLLFEKKTHSKVQGQISSRIKCVLALYNILEPTNLLWTNL